MPSIKHLIRPAVAQLDPYIPAAPMEALASRLGLPADHIIKLDANENPYGFSPRVRDALDNESYFAFYPDAEQSKIRTALSLYTNQPIERIICGNGADEIIDQLLRLILQPGDAVITCPPTFSMYGLDTKVCGGRLIEVPRHEDFSLDIPKIEHAARKSKAKALFLCSPNNPTGNAVSFSDIERLLQLPLLVVVDEAYIEFSQIAPTAPLPPSASDKVGLYENLVVLRSFSKWAGLAGLRIGYGLMPEILSDHIWKMKQPYNVSVAAQIAAVASLADLQILKENVGRIIIERERMMMELQAIPYLHPYPSQGNFIFCKLIRGTVEPLKQALEGHGILLRYYTKGEAANSVRITIGRPEQNNMVLVALQQYGKDD